MQNSHKLFFLGTRKYLHSSTLFHYLLSVTHAKENICFKFIRPIYSDCFIFSEKIDDANALFQYEENGENKQIGICELSPSEQIKKCSFDENKIIEQASFFEKEIVCSITEENFFSHCIALIKKMHELSLSKSETGRWIFSRADLKKIPHDGELKICLMNVFPSLSCSDIIQDDITIGKIYFSWVKEI